MLKNDTLKNGMSRTGLYGSLSPGPERDSKVRDAKDYGKKFRSKLAASFSGIVHWHNNFSNGIDMIQYWQHTSPIFYHLLTNWLAYFYTGEHKFPNPDVMPDRREGTMRAAGFGFARIDTQAS